MGLLTVSDSPSRPVIFTSVPWETLKVKVGTVKHANSKTETVLDVQYTELVDGSIAARTSCKDEAARTKLQGQSCKDRQRSR